MNGSVAKRPNGKWRARYRDPAGREHAKHFTTKRDASAWLDEQTAMITTGVYASPRAGRVTLSAFYAQWSARQIWAPNTRLAMDLAIRDSGLDAIALGALRRSHVESWVKRLATEGRAPSTIGNRVRNLRVVLRAAVADKMIPEDPAKGVRLPKRAGQDVIVPTPDQVGALLSAADPTFAVGIALGAFAGLRVGEVCGGQVGDVGWLTRTIGVHRQIQRAGRGGAEVRPPKAGAGRSIYVPDRLLTMLSAHIAECRPGDDPTRWLLTTDDGRPLTQDTARHRWDGARDAAGVHGVRFHDLRHYFASGLIAAGCDVVTVQRALGHHSASLTLDVYSHLWPSAEDRTRAAAGGLMDQALRIADPVRTGTHHQEG